MSVICDRSVVSAGTPVSSTNKTDRLDITEILLKVALNTINHPNQPTIKKRPQCPKSYLRHIYIDLCDEFVLHVCICLPFCRVIRDESVVSLLGRGKANGSCRVLRFAPIYPFYFLWAYLMNGRDANHNWKNFGTLSRTTLGRSGYPPSYHFTKWKEICEFWGSQVRQLYCSCYFGNKQKLIVLRMPFDIIISKILYLHSGDIRRVWRYQRGNQNPYIEEEQKTQWPKEKVQKNKQRSTKHTYKTKDRVTRTP